MTPYDVAPLDALALIREFDGPLLLDFDETLYLRNSTEDFIDSARPALAVYVALRMLDLVKPWQWTGGLTTRDVWRVRLVSRLLPWTLMRWRQHAPHLIREFANEPLLAALRERASRPVIVTLGFHPVVAPLVQALNLGQPQIVASRIDVFEDRLRGKLALSTEALGEDTVKRALVLTDSVDDLPLLKNCALPLRTLWPQARYRSALIDLYLPGRYLTRIKRPGERYIVRGILQDDFAFWLIGSLALAMSPLHHVLGLLFLLLSFWTVYECGYVDNDRIAERYETDPKLSRSFSEMSVATPTWTPWIWATVSGVIAILLLRAPGSAVPLDFAKWTGVLLSTHLWFRFYNRVDKSTRVWLYAGLQLARSAAFMVLVPVAAIGAVALGAHALAKWMPYYIYRSGSMSWPQASLPLTRLLFFVVLTSLLVLAQSDVTLLSWTAAALLGWNLLRAHKELREVAVKARRLDRPAT